MVKMDPLLKKILKVIEEKGWTNFELKDAVDDKFTLAQVHEKFPSRLSVLEALGHYIDQTTLANIEHFEDSETTRDKLFSIMMTRFDTLTSIKPVINNLWQEAWKDPVTLACSLPMGMNSMCWLLQGAGVHTTGIRGALRVKAFGICYLATVWTWLSDNTEGLDETMAALDTNLERISQFPGFYSSN